MVRDNSVKIMLLENVVLYSMIFWEFDLLNFVDHSNFKDTVVMYCML